MVLRQRDYTPLSGRIKGEKENELSKDIGRLEIFEISAHNKGERIISVLNELGFDYTARDIEFKLERRVAKILNYLTKKAEEATKSVIPVRTGALRNRYVVSTPAVFHSGARASMSRIVYVDNKDHIPLGGPDTYKHPTRVIASTLALHKDEKPEVRFKTSWSVPPFDSRSGTSKGWIDAAHHEFDKYLEQFIASLG